MGRKLPMYKAISEAISQEMKKKVEEFIRKKIDKGLYPGCQVLIGHQRGIVLNLSLGSMVKGSMLCYRDGSSDNINNQKYSL